MAEDEDDLNVFDNFFGVYMLYCTNVKYKGRTYIGYTVNPNRRVKQHNKGRLAGGARRTSNKGPWEMVLIIHGFLNDITALQFEWAWQHPYRSIPLRHLSKKKPREKMFDYNLRILAEMLQVGPWKRMPLTIRWLKQEYEREFPVNRCPPTHMPIAYGPVEVKKASSSSTATTSTGASLMEEDCHFCIEKVNQNSRMFCLSPNCAMTAHIICLAEYFNNDDCLIPIEGPCPSCGITLLWGDLVRQMKRSISD